MSCEGCKLEAIRNKTQETKIHEEAKQYANENKVETVVYQFFTNKLEWAYTTATAAREQNITNITAFYAPQHQ